MEQSCQTSVNTKSLISNNCVICSTVFEAIRKSKCCSERCRSIVRRNKKNTGILGVDYVECPVCSQHVKQITIKHAKMHGFNSLAELKEKYNLDKVTCVSIIESNSGKNNPGYNHGGKYSKWSKNFIHGYDSERHAEFSKEMSNFQKNNIDNKFRYEHWLREANGDEILANELYKNSQIRNIDWFIGKYGEEEGKRRHRAKTEKWVKTIDSKSVEELQEINSKKVRRSKHTYSKREKELFCILHEHFGELVSQFSLPRENKDGKKKFYVYDIQYKYKIIEFNGDFWHANPNIYPETFIDPYTKRTQRQIIEKDIDKKKIAEIHGYTVYTVWESDYITDKQKVIQECIDFLTKQ